MSRNDELSKNDKVALVRLTEGEFTSSVELADDMGITKGYANNILTKLKILGYVKKQWVTKDQFIIPATTPSDRWSIADIINCGVVESRFASSHIVNLLLDISLKIRPTYINPPKKLNTVSGTYCKGCDSICVDGKCECGINKKHVTCTIKIYENFIQ